MTIEELMEGIDKRSVTRPPGLEDIHLTLLNEHKDAGGDLHAVVCNLLFKTSLLL